MMLLISGPSVKNIFPIRLSIEKSADQMAWTTATVSTSQRSIKDEGTGAYIIEKSDLGNVSGQWLRARMYVGQSGAEAIICVICE